MRIDSGEFVCIDVEATGLSTDDDEIVEVAAVRFVIRDGEVSIVDSYHTLVNPSRPIPVSSTKIHNINDQMVKNKPLIGDILLDIFSFVGNHIVVGHNILYDVEMINNAARRRSIEGSIDPSKTIDTLRLARIYGESPNNSLQALREHFDVIKEDVHRALGDARVNAQIFLHLSKRFSTTEEVFERLSRPVEMRAMPLGKYKGKPFSDIPDSYLCWASHQNFDGDLRYSIDKERKLRRKKKFFTHRPFSGL